MTTTNTNTNTNAATPCKLRNGDWGAKTSARIRQGDIVTITTRAGKSWDARISKIVWTGNGVAICATASLDRPQRSATARNSRRTRRAGTWTGCSCGSREEHGETVPAASNCSSCRFEAEDF